MRTRFTWDPAKARSNLAKHGISFETAEAVWDDPLHVILPDRFEGGEQRWHAVGRVGHVTVLLVVHVYSDDENDLVVRIVGARKASPHERRRYEEGT